jgi:phosphatidate cytidylyltransferase
LARALPETALPATDGKWSDFSIRFISAAILSPIALAALWFGGVFWAALVAVAMAGLGREWAALSGQAKTSLIPIWLGCIWVSAYLFGIEAGLIALVLLTLLVAYRNGKFAAAGLPYAAIGGLSLLWLRTRHGHGFADTLLVVATVWGTDIGAYVIGRIFGGKKLAPKISPGKTWSGSIGGLTAGALAAAISASFLGGNIWLAFAIGAAISIAAQAGDLAESAIKRKLGVKDSGDTIPGHGGLFDRLDGFLAAAPLAVILLGLLQGGGPLWR